MKKNFILDTNVLLHDPNAYNQFADNNIIIPLTVIEEIDRFKKEVTERGRSARQVARTLEEQRAKGRLNDGVPLENGGTLRVMFPNAYDPLARNMPADDIILKSALELKDTRDEPCIIISKDINLRLKADALGLQAENYENGHVDPTQFYAGHQELLVDDELLALFEENGRIPVPDGIELSANQYIKLYEEENPSEHKLGRYDADAGRIVALIPVPQQMAPIMPRNDEQRFALDALLNDDIKLVTLVGKAGTGKTLLAVAAGVFKTIDERKYKKMLVSRPTFPMGKDLGYLPGDIEEKLNPWMQPIQDALELVRHGRGKDAKLRDLFTDSEYIDVEPLTYIRGRSIPNQFLIIDEVQNLTPLEVKTVITRVGHGSKVVLTGDIYQIDNPYVDVLSNGLNAVAERFRPYSLGAHVMLMDGVRSKIAELAANVM
ncbi:MAG: PhoH family protein [Spartobacteria bacterium]|nr:PhoH family protein [Spartobacteria bacterium]